MSGYRSISLWMDEVDDDLTPRPPLDRDERVDVAIVGAGYTGLWTAYYLAKADPGLRIAVVEAEIAGYGASGRNGGWCSALFAASRRRIARRHGRGAAVAMQKAMFETVDEVGRVCSEEEIDAAFEKGGTLTVATAPTHVERLRDELDCERAWGFDEDDLRWLPAEECQARVRLSRCLGALVTPHCAVVQPAALVRGLARAVERLGVRIYERTPARAIETGEVVTARGTVHAGVVVRATEGYTPRLDGHRRAVLPLYSLMIATEPLPASFWAEVGWRERETLTDARHLLIYAQRTADDRIAIGGRGAPYHFGSRTQERFDRDPRVFEELHRVLVDLFPAARDAAVTHRWGGPLGVPRDWFSSVGYERARRIAWAGGYVGDGVSTANLAGRTLRDLILGHGTEITRLPWVGHRSRRWPLEPFRWVGVNLGLRIFAGADRVEARRGRPARRTDVLKRVVGID